MAYPQPGNPWPQPGNAGSPPGYGQIGQMPQQYGQMPQGYGQPPNSMQASDLINADALPEWLRNVGQGPSATPPAPPPQSNGNGRAGAYSAQLAGNGRGAPAGFGQPNAPSGPRYAPTTGNVAGPSGSGQLGFGQPAATLFDESALPDWLRQASMGQEIEVAPPARQHLPGAAPGYPAYGMPGGAGSSEAGAAGHNGYQAPPAAPRMPERNQPAPHMAPPSQASAFPSLEQAGAYRPAPPSQTGVSGHSLLDPGALPAWLGGQPGAQMHSPNGMSPNISGMSAQSLVDESALPQWLRAEPNLPATPPAPSYGTPASSGSPAASTNQGMSGWGATPASAEPLPQWLNQVYTDANVPRTEQRPAGMPMTGGLGAPGYGAPNPGSFSPNLTGGTVSAADFVDESALPEWLKSQGAAENGGNAATPPNAYPPSVVPPFSPAPQVPPATGSLLAGTVPEHRAAPLYSPSGAASDEPPARFSASDLIDPSAIPSWVTGQSPAPEQSFSSANGWTVKQAAAPSVQQERDATFGTSYGGTGERGRESGYLRGAEPADASWQGQPASREDSGRYHGGYGRMPEPEPNRRAAKGPGQRRGPPIPREELPPWLQRSGQAQDRESHMGQSEYEMDWDDNPQGAAPEWNDWGDQPRGGDRNSYARRDEYAEYDNAEPEQRQRGGWRRLFGRK